MDEKRKKTILFIGTVIVAIMFVTSYAAFGNNGIPTTSTTTQRQTTYYSTGTSNAAVTGYGSSISVVLLNKSASNTLNSTISQLEANNTITNFIPTSRGYVLYAPGNAPYVVQQAFLSSLPVNSISLNGSERVVIPNSFILFYYGSAIHVYTNVTNFTVTVSKLSPIGASTRVNIQALVLPNGQIYNNEIQVAWVGH